MPIVLRHGSRFAPTSRVSRLCLVLVGAALAASCATKPPEPAPAPQVQPLAQYMAEAGKAHTDRMAGKERDTYRTAARVYPTAKEPWVKLAESYFEAQDYGNAILAAQEVLQRDAADQMASGVLAVSGLRVSTQALQSLRGQNTSLPPDTRSQAEGLARTLREVLGEPVLVPKPADASATSPAAAASAPKRRTVPAPGVKPAASKPAGSTKTKSPFDD